ncbi:MAG: class I SAM-dependent methyltransferase [Verrucomicrobia bacterium]|nr:class I SAM-dependent methyltransferase [Verrucomicrobiota bacterium]
MSSCPTGTSTAPARTRHEHLRKVRRIATCALTAALVAVGAGCRTQTASPPPNALATPSVAPGINAEYLKPDLNVSQWVERFEREGREIYDHRHRIVLESGVRKGMTVADVGAGSGLFTLLFAEAVGRRGTVYAVDIVPAFLTHIEAEALGRNLDNVRPVLASERSASLPERSVDLVFICDTYHHFEYPAETLASLHAALRPRGRLVLVEFHREEGRSSDWIMRHVRAGQAVFEAEITRAGFRKIRETPFLRENYFVVFEKERR